MTTTVIPYTAAAVADGPMIPELVAAQPQSENSSPTIDWQELRTDLPIPLLETMNVLYELEDDLTIALCLDWGIAAQGDSIDSARVALATALEIQRGAYLTGATSSIGRRSPQPDWDRFGAGTVVAYPGGLESLAKAVVERMAR